MVHSGFRKGFSFIKYWEINVLIYSYDQRSNINKDKNKEIKKM